MEHGQPHQTLALHDGAGPWELNLHNQRSGPTAQLDRTNHEADQVVRARWIPDARLSYQLRPRMQVAVSAVKLFDGYPDEWSDFRDGLQAQGASMQGIFRYPGALSPFGMNGRTVDAQLSYR